MTDGEVSYWRVIALWAAGSLILTFVGDQLFLEGELLREWTGLLAGAAIIFAVGFVPLLLLPYLLVRLILPKLARRVSHDEPTDLTLIAQTCITVVGFSVSVWVVHRLITGL